MHLYRNLVTFGLHTCMLCDISTPNAHKHNVSMIMNHVLRSHNLHHCYRNNEHI